MFRINLLKSQLRIHIEPAIFAVFILITEPIEPEISPVIGDGRGDGDTAPIIQQPTTLGKCLKVGCVTLGVAVVAYGLYR